MHCALLPVFPTSFQPGGFVWSTGQIEYCSSWLMTTLYLWLSGKSLNTPPPLSQNHSIVNCEGSRSRSYIWSEKVGPLEYYHSVENHGQVFTRTDRPAPGVDLRSPLAAKKNPRIRISNKDLELVPFLIALGQARRKGDRDPGFPPWSRRNPPVDLKNRVREFLLDPSPRGG